ncbi:MoxR family ATPase [Myxococcota bacterium]|nr:MoxR family ATPase [Myxococcota bacterium]MBU1430675.1 MoxR family ATPase [Myxococcota bacterium]MBU1898257.1 MoxR family ATPase [Myxococcota bacterium]
MVLREALRAQLAQIYAGPVEIIDRLLIAALAGGHVLLEGVPGVAKTTLAKAFAASLGCAFSRVQFTPDLLPADITGGYILNLRTQEFTLRRGPIFTHVLLGDEINRAPAKTQAALLEAMQEGQVTLEGETLPLPDPFLVLATQNPMEQEGVYPLPEAQVDRFLMKIAVPYPSEAQERAMLDLHGRAARPSPPALLDPARLKALRAEVEAIHVSEAIRDYIVALARASRVDPAVSLGASPRAALALMRAAKAAAHLDARDFTLPDDVRALAQPVLAHRLSLHPEAALEGLTPEAIIEGLLDAVPYRGPADR